MSQNMGEMVAIASGTRNRVGRWARALRAAAIAFLVITPMTTSEGDQNDTELWVANDDAEEARHAIQFTYGPKAHDLW
jgi:hypothetical protein